MKPGSDVIMPSGATRTIAAAAAAQRRRRIHAYAASIQTGTVLLLRAIAADRSLRTLRRMARILIAEDDDQMRAFLSRGLRRAGHAVEAAGDGEAALEIAGSTNYDLLLADIMMPGIDGVELARRVSAQQPGIRVMFITGFAAVAMLEDWLGEKRPPVLAKPFHLRHLTAEIDALLTR
jgi:two-component system, cell cycle response regulator CpdR